MNELILKEVLATMPLGLCVLDPDGRISFWNEAAERLAGYSAAEVTGRRCCDGVLIHLDEQGRELCGPEGCGVACHMLRQAPFEATVYLRHQIGHRIRSTTHSIPITGSDGALLATALVFNGSASQSERDMELERLKEIALLDPLTHIGNRRFAERAINTTLAENKRHESSFGALFADIDNFKKINDRHGHCAGDKMLKIVAQTLTQGVRLYDVVCRWGGDEFLVLLHHVTPEQMGARAESLRRLVRHSQLEVDNDRVGVTISIGATMGRRADALDKLVERADWLMYRSKNSGGDQVTFG